MKKECKAKIVARALGSLLVGTILLTTIMAHTPALAQLSNYNPQGLKATTLEEVLVLPDEEIDLATAIMVLYKEWDASFDVKESLEEIAKMVLELKVLIDSEDNPERIVGLINYYLFDEMSYSIPDRSSRSGLMMLEKKALPQVIKNKKGDCLGLSLLYLVLTECLGLPFYGVIVPNHFFVRYDDGKKKINVETTRKGKTYEDSYYEKKYKLHPTYRKCDFYLRNLSKKEVVGVFLSSLGAAYIDRGMYDEAIVELEKAIEMNPSYEEAYTNLGVAYAGKGMYDEAISEYNKAIEIDPSDASAHCNLGAVYSHKGMHDEAIVELRKAIEINPSDAVAYTNLGVIYGRKAMYDDGITAHKKAIEINPNFAQAHSNLGAAYYKKGEYNLAIKHYDRAVELGYRVRPKLLELLKPYRER